VESVIRRVVLTALGALVGWIGGWVSGAIGHLSPQPADYPFLVEYVPLPHHVPQYAGGLSFRFAMAHDVIHERFPKHGPTHYRERNRLTREKLAALDPDDPAAFSLADDLAAGLERLGESGEAVAVMRDKLRRQQATKRLAGRDLYTSYANLGTFLIHDSHREAVGGYAHAREQFREGVGFIRKSVEVNPEAHFGRERWQLAIAEFLLAVMEKPDLLKTFDCLGNRLDFPIDAILAREGTFADAGYGRAIDAEFFQGRVADHMPAFFLPNAQPDEPSLWPKFSPIRRHITKIGAEEGWDAVPVPSHRSPVPFDEPMLGIIGMWRQGSGANPYFALALGETMLRVGQRYIAWAAYERAVRLAGRFWPDPAAQQFLRDHCRKRQGQIEKTLSFQAPTSTRRPAWQHVSPPPAEGVEDLRPAFEAELAHGEGYQQAYQRYELEKIAAGVPITDEHFFDEFHAGREPIASPVGPEEWFAGVPPKKAYAYAARRREAWGMFGAGLAALAAALLSRRRPRAALSEFKVAT
jgi:hypothetical protein